MLQSESRRVGHWRAPSGGEIPSLPSQYGGDRQACHGHRFQPPPLIRIHGAYPRHGTKLPGPLSINDVEDVLDLRRARGLTASLAAGIISECLGPVRRSTQVAVDEAVSIVDPLLKTGFAGPSVTHP